MNGSFSFVAEAGNKRYAIFAVYTSFEITINFGNMKELISEDVMNAFRMELNRLPNVSLPHEVVTKGKYPYFSLDSLRKPEDLDIFESALKSLLSKKD